MLRDDGGCVSMIYSQSTVGKNIGGVIEGIGQDRVIYVI